MFGRLFKALNNKKTYIVGITVLATLALLLAWGLVSRYIDGQNTQDMQDIARQEAEIIVEDPSKKLEEVFNFLAIDFTELKKRNSDVVGWLRVNNTSIDYPVVQTTDNEFYLKRNLDKVKSTTGWIFADFRSNLDVLDFNTTIYGHNLIDNLMFGSLNTVSLDDISSIPNTRYINLTLLNKQLVFQICSTYVTTFDDTAYYGAKFTGDSPKQVFIDEIKQKNTAPTYTVPNLSTADKFLTLSTCYGGVGTTKRYVVHARLVAEKQVSQTITSSVIPDEL